MVSNGSSTPMHGRNKSKMVRNIFGQHPISNQQPLKMDGKSWRNAWRRENTTYLVIFGGRRAWMVAKMVVFVERSDGDEVKRGGRPR
jgi:hypothetical protein